MLWSYENTFVCKENKNNDFKNFFSFVSVFDACSRTVPRRIHEPFLRLQTSCSASRFYVRIPAPASAASQACIMVLSWTSDEDWHEGEEILKVVIFVFFAHKKYSCSFLKWRLNHWCHMDYFNDILTTLNVVVALLYIRAARYIACDSHAHLVSKAGSVISG